MTVLGAGGPSTAGALATGVQPLGTQALRVPPGAAAGDPAAKRAYASSLAFEQVLVGELAQSLVQGTGLGGESEEGGGAAAAGAGGEGASSANPLLASLVPQALSEGIMRQGGLGLAGALTDAIDPAAATAAQPGKPATAAGATAAEAAVGGAEAVSRAEPGKPAATTTGGAGA